MISTEQLTELTRLCTEYTKAAKKLNRLARTPSKATANEVIDTKTAISTLHSMINYQASRISRGVSTTTQDIVTGAPHLQEHPRLRMYAPHHQHKGHPTTTGEGAHG